MCIDGKYDNNSVIESVVVLFNKYYCKSCCGPVALQHNPVRIQKNSPGL